MSNLVDPGYQQLVPPLQPRAEPSLRHPVSPRPPALTFRWAWKVGTVAGIDVNIHASFLLLIALIVFSDFAAGQNAAAVLRSTLLILAIFAAVVLHELGHALMARRFGVRTSDITLWPIGGVARLDRMPDLPKQQLLVAIAGPSVNLLIALLLYGILSLVGAPAGLTGFTQPGSPFFTQLMWFNVSLALFNLLPGYPMDGGRILRAFLAMRLEPVRATQIAARVGQCVAVLLGLVGAFGSPLLMVIALFVWMGATAEHSASTMKLALTGILVQNAMLTDFKSVSVDDPLERAVDLTLAGFQRDFPVMDGANLVGLLTHTDVSGATAVRGASLSVHQAMRREFDTASPLETLDGALSRLQRSALHTLLVVDNERVVGLLTARNIEERLALYVARHPPRLAQEGEPVSASESTCSSSSQRDLPDRDASSPSV